MQGAHKSYGGVGWLGRRRRTCRRLRTCGGRKGKEWAQLGGESMGNEVESEAEQCQEALSNVLDPTAKKIMICTHSKRWWTGVIPEKKSQLVRENIRRRRSAAPDQVKADLQKLVWRAKDKMCNDYQNNLRGAEVWRAAKFPSQRTGMTI
jgi:hypothetical protein